MRRALIGFLMAATVATPLAAQTADSQTERRGGFGSRVRDAVRSERPERPRTEQRTERREERQEERQARRSNRRSSRAAQGSDEVVAQSDAGRRERPRTWGQSVSRAIDNEQRQDRQRARLERQRELERYRDWRHDSRYDWERWRYANRGIFNGGRYYSPWYGDRYRPLSIGIRLGSPFYSNRYWISDPWQYRLPPAYPGTRWVRYYDDVVLVDVYDGQVLDVIRNFFW